MVFKADFSLCPISFIIVTGSGLRQRAFYVIGVYFSFFGLARLGMIQSSDLAKRINTIETVDALYDSRLLPEHTKNVQQRFISAVAAVSPQNIPLLPLIQPFKNNQVLRMALPFWQSHKRPFFHVVGKRKSGRIGGYLHPSCRFLFVIYNVLLCKSSFLTRR